MYGDRNVNHIHACMHACMHTSIRILRYMASAGLPALGSSRGCVWLCVAPCSLDGQKKMRSAVRLRSGSRFSARLGSSGRSRDVPGTLRGSIFEAETTVSSTVVASDRCASARPPEPYETLRGCMNFRLQAFCGRHKIGRTIASNAARR